ncbi:hypothetical protein POTOM_016731 [Populus tomentosa]|uniref:Secreted protein n=1 Tax=Populus tomentosa TaxID=118781 RepID=A0A8X7ZXN5_POPTO|nr:hypothetical protein POTOM_016731 [Populus tomentosa]
MKLLKLFFALSATIATVAALHSDHYNENSNMQSQLLLCEIQETVTSLRGLGRVLAQQNTIANSTCNKLPRICRLKRSPGPDCCNKKCVDVKTDRFNCGMIVMMILFGEMSNVTAIQVLTSVASSKVDWILIFVFLQER